MKGSSRSVRAEGLNLCGHEQVIAFSPALSAHLQSHQVSSKDSSPLSCAGIFVKKTYWPLGGGRCITAKGHGGISTHRDGIRQMGNTNVAITVKASLFDRQSPRSFRPMRASILNDDVRL